MERPLFVLGKVGKKTRTKIKRPLNSVISKIPTFVLFSNRSSSMGSRVTVQCWTPWPPVWTQPPESAISRCTHSWLTKRMCCLTRQRSMGRSWRDKSISGRTSIPSSTRPGSNYISCNNNAPQRCVLFSFCCLIIRMCLDCIIKRDLN